MGGRCWWLSKAHMHISQWESFPHRLGGFLRYFDCEHVDVPVEGWAVEDTHVMRLTQRPWMSRVGTTSLGVDQNKCEDIPKLGPLKSKLSPTFQAHPCGVCYKETLNSNSKIRRKSANKIRERKHCLVALSHFCVNVILNVACTLLHSQ